MYQKISRRYLNRINSVFILFILFFSSKSVTRAQESEYAVEAAGQFGGQAGAAFVEDNYVYLGQGAALVILDLSGSEIKQIGIIPVEDEILALHKNGSVLYCLLNNSAGLQVVDISNASTPTLVGYCAIETNRTAAMDLYGQHLYIAAEQGGFQIVDISDPAAPFVASPVDLFYPSDIKIADGYAFALFASSSPAKLRSFDLSDPLNPQFRAQIDAPRGQSITLAEDQALVACAEYTGGSNGMRIFDISDPLNLVEKSFLKVQNRTYTVTAFDDHAYLACQDSILVADISNPVSPTVIGRYDVAGPSHAEYRGASCDGQLFYIHSRYSDHPLEIIDVTDPTQPQSKKSFISPHNVSSLKAVDDQLYVASAQYLFTYDLGNRKRPALSATYEEYGNLGNLKTVNNLLTATLAFPSTLYFFNLDAPDHITTAAQVQISSGMIMDYCFVGSHAFVLTDMKKLVSLDLTDINNMQTVSTVDLGGSPRAVAASDKWLWSAFGAGDLANGLEIFDITNPTAPVHQSTLDLEATPTCLFLHEDTLFVGKIVSNTQFKLSAYLVSDQPGLQPLAEAFGTGKIWDIEVRDGAILAAVEGGSVIRFVLNAVMKTLQQVAECPSPGSLKLTTTPADANGVGTLYTAEGSSWERFGSALKKTAGGNSIGYGNYGVAIQTFKAKKLSAVEKSPAFPLEFSLHQNYPNPFNPITTIQFDLKTTGRVTLTLYDLLGRKVRVLTDDMYNAGRHSTTIDAGTLPSGLYFYHLKTAAFEATRKCLLIK
jgi:hypothetical protein